jgi:hypothetical protein
MRSSILLLSFILLCSFGKSQTLPELNQDRIKTQKTSMLVLGGWGGASLISGAALYGVSEGENRSFHLMNMGWGAVNLGLAAAGYVGARKQDPAAFDLYSSLNEQHKTEKILLFNAGLDVGYMLGGLFLMERSKTGVENPEQLKGFGKSILLQGAGLFVFDLSAYLAHASHRRKWKAYINGFSFDGQKVGFNMRF